jgi:hypothetical protein
MNKFTDAGFYFYTAAVAGIGVIMQVFGGFLKGLLPVPVTAPLHGVLWLGTSLVFIVAAVAAMAGFRRKPALVAIGVVFLLYLVGLHLPILFSNLYNGGAWAATFEVIMLASGAFILAGVRVAAVVGHYLFAASLFLFAIQHMMYFDYIVSLIPAWMPVKVGLAWLVIAGYVLCGISFLIGRGVGLAAFWLGIMFGLWVLLLHAPRAMGKWNSEPEWTSMCVALAVCGIAFFIARREAVNQPEPLILLPRA